MVTKANGQTYWSYMWETMVTKVFWMFRYKYVYVKKLMYQVMQDNTGTLSKKTGCLYRFPTVTTNCWDIRTQACSPIRIGKQGGCFPFCWIHIKTRFSVSHRRMSWSVPPQRIGVYHLQDVNGPNGPPMSRPGSGFTVPSVHPPGSGTGIQTTCHSLRRNFVTDVHLAWLAEEDLSGQPRTGYTGLTQNSCTWAKMAET